MKILLINPNRYQFPPVIPVALEYLAGELESSHHEYSILDLCFFENPVNEIKITILKEKPDIVGITIRQIDTVLYHNNEFFLEEIKDYISIIKEYNLKVILGGIGFSIMPDEILKFTGADYGVIGPGEKALIRLLDYIEKNEKTPKLLNGYEDINTKYYKFTRKKVIDYDEYLKNDGIVGFRTQIGCNEACIFCTEGKKRIVYHYPQDVGSEIAYLKKAGYHKFHLCDSEFNLNLKHCIEVCRAIVKIAGPVDWSLYMKSSPFSDDLFYWLKQSGATSITVSLNTQDVNDKNLVNLKLLFRFIEKHKIKVAIDLSTGFPYEVIDQLLKTIQFLENQPVDTVGVNAFYRIYPGTPLYELITKDRSLIKYLVNWNKESDFIYPVFFNYFNEKQIREIIDGKPKFRLEGFEKASNYQRIQKK